MITALLIGAGVLILVIIVVILRGDGWTPEEVAMTRILMWIVLMLLVAATALAILPGVLAR
jgi:multisubunit Na+/H+ antiporter MnhB subunit